MKYAILYLKRKKYRHICEGDLDNHVMFMRREGYWGTNLELLAFSDLMRLNINTITITMLLCKELILIRGQPPRQGGSPRATLDRGEFT